MKTYFLKPIFWLQGNFGMKGEVICAVRLEKRSEKLKRLGNRDNFVNRSVPKMWLCEFH